MKEENACGACACASTPNEDRRKLLRMAAGGLVASLIFDARLSHANPAGAGQVFPGDLLVEEDAEGQLVPIKSSDLQTGKPVTAYPFDAAKGVVRNESRFNKVVLLRLAEADLSPRMKEVSAGGVLAFSAVCTHQGCDVKTWMSKEQVLACFCHGSKFSPFEAGAVTAGPAPRALPVLPLKLKDGKLVVAAPFSSPPGFKA